MAGTAGPGNMSNMPSGHVHDVTAWTGKAQRTKISPSKHQPEGHRRGQQALASARCLAQAIDDPIQLQLHSMPNSKDGGLIDPAVWQLWCCTGCATPRNSAASLQGPAQVHAGCCLTNHMPMHWRTDFGCAQGLRLTVFAAHPDALGQPVPGDGGDEVRHPQGHRKGQVGCREDCRCFLRRQQPADGRPWIILFERYANASGSQQRQREAATGRNGEYTRSWHCRAWKEFQKFQTHSDSWCNLRHIADQAHDRGSPCRLWGLWGHLWSCRSSVLPAHVVVNNALDVLALLAGRCPTPGYVYLAAPGVQAGRRTSTAAPSVQCHSIAYCSSLAPRHTHICSLPALLCLSASRASQRRSSPPLSWLTACFTVFLTLSAHGNAWMYAASCRAAASGA